MSLRRLVPIVWFAWTTGLTALVGLLLFPVSSGITRITTVILLMALWLGLIYLCWSRRFGRFAMLGVTTIVIGLMCLPSRASISKGELREDYVRGLRRYKGTAYYWGGESPLGIDCSGLVRRGLIDALLLDGLRELDGQLIRRSLSIWWHDSSARAMGLAKDGGTTFLFDARNIRSLDHSKLSIGDLAVTADGLHVLAYTGGSMWIQADPAVQQVIEVSASDSRNVWLDSAIRLVRWKELTD